MLYPAGLESDSPACAAGSRRGGYACTGACQSAALVTGDCFFRSMVGSVAVAATPQLPVVSAGAGGGDTDGCSWIGALASARTQKKPREGPEAFLYMF